MFYSRSMLDTAFARSRFPALADEWALFDHAGGSVPVAGVIDRVADYMRRWQVQHGATYRQSATAAAFFAEGRRAMAEFVGAVPDEIVFGASCTANLRMIARALAPLFSPGDEIVVTDLDHEANVGPWRALEADGLVVREWRVDRDTLALDPRGLESVLGPRTRLVCFTHCSNITGTIQDAAALVRLIHDAGALACVDGVAFAPHRRVDVRAIGADLYSVALYKTFGPHVGLLHGRHELLRRARGQNHYFIGEDQVPSKFEAGNATHELVAALPGILEYLLELEVHAFPEGGGSHGERLDRVFGAIAEHEAELCRPLITFLASRAQVRIIGHPDADARRHVPTVSFSVAGRSSREIVEALDAQKIGARYGHFYAHRTIESLGLLGQDGVVRISMLHTNTVAEVERLIAALSRVV
jgi:cysteine desulfurase family protein (TIGR01976 family)